MSQYTNNQSYQPEPWDERNAYPQQDTRDEYSEYEDYDEYDEYGEYEDYEAYEQPDLDQELDSEHHFRIAMNVFDLISTLIGLVVILVLAGLLFSLFNWVQRDISQSLFVITAPFR